MNTMLKVFCVVAARPNFMKIAPIMKVLNASERVKAVYWPPDDRI